MGFKVEPINFLNIYTPSSTVLEESLVDGPETREEVTRKAL